MLLHYSRLTDYTVYGKEDELGKVHDIYFDEQHWTVRYLVLKTGISFLSERLFISPAQINKLSHSEGVIRTLLAQDELQKAPDPDKEPVTRKFEKDFNTHYKMNPYWEGSGIWGGATTPEDMMSEKALTIAPDDNDRSQYVHQAREVKGYELSTADDTFGKAEDFLIDPSSFKIKYIVADTRKWLPGGKKILISADWITSVRWDMALIKIDAEKEQVEKAPEYLNNEPLTPDMEQELWMHYGKQD